MSSVSRKAEFLAEQEAIWEEALESLFACYKQHPEDTLGVMRHFDAVTDFNFVPQNLQSTAGELAYEWYEWDIVRAIRRVQSFVSHEIHDDGSPCLVWFAPEPVETEGLNKVQALQAQLRTPWKVVPKEEGKICSLVRDPGDVLPHREFVTSCAEGSPLVAEALAAVARRDEREAKWARLTGKDSFVRKPSTAQEFFLELLAEWETK